MNADVMKWLGMLLAGAGWFALVVMGKADVDTFVQFVQYTLIGIGAHAMTTRGRPADSVVVEAAPKPGPQAGVSTPILLLLIVLVLYGFLLTACTTVPSLAVNAVKASDDNAIENWKLLACGMPLSAILRHPEVIPSLKSLCLPAGGTADPASLLPGKP